MSSTRSPAILLRTAAILLLCTHQLACHAPARIAEEPIAVPAAAVELPQPAKDSVRYRVDGRQSDVRILVYRGGPLAKVGHNHVVRVQSLRGDIHLAPRFDESTFELGFPVADLQVDPADARADEGADFAVTPSAQAVRATFENLTGSAVLDADNYPEVALRSVGIVGPEWGPELTVRVSLHGIERDVVVPVAILRTQDVLTVTGLMRLRTSDFGITPFSVLGGGLQVLDAVKIRFRIVARR
jgi:polyisoprenoid-binding protein YceI